MSSARYALEASALLATYRQALAEARPHAPPSEESLYALHMREAERLAGLLETGASSHAVAELIGSERRSFGWAYLSGTYGDRVERAFHALASQLEQQCT